MGSSGGSCLSAPTSDLGKNPLINADWLIGVEEGTSDGTSKTEVTFFFLGRLAVLGRVIDPPL